MGRGISLAAAAGLAVFLVIAPTAAASPPTISYTIDGIAGTNGWYRGSSHGNNVVLRWRIDDPSSVIISTSGCEPAIPIPGPTTGTTRTCTVQLEGGAFMGRTTDPPIKIDAQPPTNVAPHPSRAPDFGGWYNHPVAVTWGGQDATSGIAGCSSLTYSGPNRPGTFVAGGCTDKAGNSASSRFTLNYDATPPTLRKVAVTSEPGANVLRWKRSSRADRIVVQRAARHTKAHRTVFEGSASRFVDRRIRPSVEYFYTVRAFDQAGNASQEVSLAGLPRILTLHKMGYVPRAAPRPILEWLRKPGAAYYHVQLFRGSRRVLAAWPTAHRLGLPAAWRWGGHRYRLRPGHYRWYVWAGVGARSSAQYHAIGSAKFIVPKHRR